MKVLGIMSGTSIDGVDYALCDVTARSVKLVKHWARDFPSTLRRRLHAAAANGCRAHELGQLHHDLGRVFATQAKALKAGAELVGLHGQTVFHNPDRNAPATLQLGEPAYLAEALRIPVVNNFRAADIAVGGQGAPLATFFHKVVFARRGRHVCVNNLGGISNVTSIDWRHGKQPGILAFDTGPANILLDLAVRHFTAGGSHFDVNGAWASQGRVNEVLLARWLRHPFFATPPPKSTGRELFGEKFWRTAWPAFRGARLSRFDVLATLAEFTARTIALNYRLHLPSTPDVVILCGGGANNRMLMRRIQAAFEKQDFATRVYRSAEFGWPVETIEPAAFALLACFRWRGIPANIPATTGARRAVLLGQITQSSRQRCA